MVNLISAYDQMMNILKNETVIGNDGLLQKNNLSDDRPFDPLIWWERGYSYSNGFGTEYIGPSTAADLEKFRHFLEGRIDNFEQYDDLDMFRGDMSAAIWGAFTIIAAVVSEDVFLPLSLGVAIAGTLTNGAKISAYSQLDGLEDFEDLVGIAGPLIVNGILDSMTESISALDTDSFLSSISTYSGLVETLSESRHSLSGGLDELIEFKSRIVNSISDWISKNTLWDNGATFGTTLENQRALEDLVGLEADLIRRLSEAAEKIRSEGGLSSEKLEKLEELEGDLDAWEDMNFDFWVSVFHDPLVLDLDGDGIETTSPDESNASFDLNSDGILNGGHGWISGDDGFLALDKNGNGIIDSASELFGDELTSGFEELAELDTNGDGDFNSHDLEFSDVLVWQDTNGNGTSEPEELYTLEMVGIASISTRYDATVEFSNGNLISATGSYTLIDGGDRIVADVFLNDENDWDPVSWDAYG